MKTQITALSAVALLALTACGDDGGDTGSDDTETQDRIAALETQVDELAQALEESESTDAESANGPEDEEPEGQEGGSVWEDSDADDDESEPTGGEPAEIGEAAPIDQWLTGEPVGTLTLDEIERNYTNPACAEWGDDPESGEFVALHFSVEADPGAEEAAIILEDDFYLVDDDSNMLRQEIHTASAWSCSIEAGVLESAPPGTISSGVVLLDTTLESGTLVYDGGETDVRWEF